jgi:beta-lactamase regulating signal transducer with metallopeptidase domain
MLTFDALSSLALEAVLFGLAIGIGLTMAVAISMRLFGPINAATRALVWMLALVTLPLIPTLYFVGHVPGSVHPVTIAVAHASRSVAPAVRSAPVAVRSGSPVPAERQFQVPLPEHLPEGLFGLYLAIVPLLLFRLFVSYIRLRLLRRRTDAAPAELNARLEQWLLRCPTTRLLELRISNRARSPLAVGFLRPLIVMPADLVLELTAQEYDDLGVHELAHLKRYDDWTNLLQRILQAFLFFHPAAHYIGRRLNLERELACDDWVVAAHESKSYVRCLAKVAELRKYRRGALLLSSGAFFGKRQILKRVESLLDKSRNAATAVSGLTIAAVVVMLAAFSMQVIHLPDVIAFTQEQGSTTSMRWSDDSRDLRIKLRGDVSFAGNDQSVSSLSPDGFLIIDESKGWSHRRVEVRPGQAGAVETKYFLDGREKAMDGVGRAWAATMYLFAIRELGVDAEARVSRMLAHGGVSTVLQEVDLIHSDGVKRKYLTQLLDQATLTNSDLERVNDSVRKISSDGDKADFLAAHERDLCADQIQMSFFRAVNSISSDGDRRRVLIGVLQSSGKDPEMARLVALSAKGMSSDGDKADVLLAIPPDKSSQASCALLSAARDIQSDGDKARVLHDSAYVDSSGCRDVYFSVVSRIQSDVDRAGVLQNLLSQTNLTSETLQEIANSAKAMSSDGDKANVLALEATKFSGVSLFEATNSIQSSGDRARVLKAVLEHTPDKAALLNLVASAANVPDDNEKGEILLAVAKQSAEPDVRSALQQACEKLSSDNEYRRVATAIFSQPVLKQ